MDFCQLFETKIKEMVPMTGYVGFKVNEINDQSCRLTIPLNERTTNHVQSLYLAALAMGGELAPGILALYFIQLSGEPVVLVFKDMHVEFHKRADTDVTFVCEDAQALQAMVKKAIETKERQEAVATTKAYSADGETLFATFKLTVSVKLKI